MSMMKWLDSLEADGTVLDTIDAGDRLTIRTPHGGKVSGRAKLRGPAGWVFGAGKHGASVWIATAENLVKIEKRRSF